MVNPRLEFALERIGPSDWRYFEKFVSEFLIETFPDLRTTASMGGDRGRDAEIFSLDSAPRTKFQYSVTAEWRSKIKSTLVDIVANFPGTRRLIYCTNQSIGAMADDLREAAWNDDGVQVDIRDRSWFIEREADSPARLTAAAELIEVFVEPLLRERSVIQGVAAPLSQRESKVAFLQLALNESDKRSDQSLTKTSFDALAMAALTGTSAEHGKTLKEVSESVSMMLPSADANQVEALVSSALNRLSKKRGPVKYLRPMEMYHVSYAAQTKGEERTAEFLLQQDALDRDIASALFGLNDALDDDPQALLSEAAILRGALEYLLLREGESFAQSINDGSLSALSYGDLLADLDSYEMSLSVRREQAVKAILDVLESPSERTVEYLERVLDAYTLLAFLQQTPDVQKTLSKVFDGGEIWLDTSVVLPLIAETALEERDTKPFTRLFRAAVESGLNLYVTGGVIEEINGHLDNCLRYVQISSEWRGRVPYVYSAYMFSGRSEPALGEWIRNFKGGHRPELDLEESIREEFGIRRKDLRQLSDVASLELRGAVQSLWLDSHSRRRKESSVGVGVVDRLVAHDVENVVGVIERRRQTEDSPFGYTAWWLTLDRTALRLRTWLDDQLGADAPHSPAISPDYFSQLLRFGPLRRRTPGVDAPGLPVSLEIRKFEDVPPELLEVARETRVQYAEYDERRIRREVRDALDRSRTASSSSSTAIVDFDEELIDGSVTRV